jgi:LAO/AO transport system kinase
MSADHQKNINQFISKIKSQKKEPIDVEQLFHDIQSGSKSALSKGITLVESKLSQDITLAHALLQKCLSQKHSSKRIAITGIPGSGKSTFINAYALSLVNEGKKVAILSIDPSSSISYGSILGDKTRMEDISHLEQVFIRPTATGNTLGGVHLNTREAILLCEAAGYDQILVETVGVGQSEYAVQDMTDMMILILLPGSGDSLQGIKRGIMEAADVVLINKSDQFPEVNIQRTVTDYKHALHMMPIKANEWIPQVLASSAFIAASIQKVSETIDAYFKHAQLKGYFESRRKEQWQKWFVSSIGWATNEVLKSKGMDLSNEMPTLNELPPAKALEAIRKAIH